MRLQLHNLIRCIRACKGVMESLSFVRKHPLRDRGTCDGQSGANQHDDAKSKYKCPANRLSNGGCRSWIEAVGNLHASELPLFRLNGVQNVGRQREAM